MEKKDFFIGSICLSDIDKSLIKAIQTKSGTKMYLNISVGTIINKKTKEPEPDNYGNTHYISCAPKKEERKEGQFYGIGHLKKWEEEQDVQPTPEQIDEAPKISQEEADELPF